MDVIELTATEAIRWLFGLSLGGLTVGMGVACWCLSVRDERRRSRHRVRRNLGVDAEALSGLQRTHRGRAHG